MERAQWAATTEGKVNYLPGPRATTELQHGLMDLGETGRTARVAECGETANRR